MTSDHDPAAFFTARRPRLQRIANRMLGSVAEAEDVVQDAWLRWHGAERSAMQEPEAFLGKRHAAVNPIFGQAKVLRLLLADKVKTVWDTSQLLRAVSINGLPGRITRESDALLQTMALEIDNGRITAIHVMRNPDKLGHLERGAPAGG